MSKDLILCEIHYIKIIIQGWLMQNNQCGSPLLRNSYSYQLREPQQPRNPPSRPLHLPAQLNTNKNDSFASTIKSMESKIEGMENLAKRKYTMEPVSATNNGDLLTGNNQSSSQLPRDPHP